MRRLYKVILIILVASIMTYIIYYCTKDEALNIVSFGDAVASGETAYNIDGLSYNDYLMEYYEDNKMLKSYNNTFAKKNYKLFDFINDIKNNAFDENKHIYLKQLINNASLITLAFGMDEIAKFSMTDKLTEEYINIYTEEYDDLLYMIRSLNQNKIVIIGLYKANNIRDTDLILINSKISNIAKKYNAEFIDITELTKEHKYFLKMSSFYLNYQAHYHIFEMINCTISTC